MTRYYQVPVTFSEWRRFAQYTLEDCQMVFKVTRRTVSNWESGKIEPPRAVFICLQLFSGRLDFLGKRWRGFRITPEAIESPEGDFVRSEEIRALRYAMQALEIDRLRRCRMNNDEQPASFDNITFIDKAPKLKILRSSESADSQHVPSNQYLLR
jgi:transcriptional regulator with XRE-family HTH domain